MFVRVACVRACCSALHCTALRMQHSTGVSGLRITAVFDRTWVPAPFLFAATLQRLDPELFGEDLRANHNRVLARFPTQLQLRNAEGYGFAFL